MGGAGICDRGYYGGHDGVAKNSLENCKTWCLQHKECQCVSFLKGKTCSRFADPPLKGQCHRRMKGNDLNHITYCKEAVGPVVAEHNMVTVHHSWNLFLAAPHTEEEAISKGYKKLSDCNDYPAVGRVYKKDGRAQAYAYSV